MRTALPLLAVLLVALGGRADDTTDDLLTRARAVFLKGQTDEALDLSGKAIAQSPKSARPHFFRGTLYEALGKHREAVADFDRAIVLDPKGAEAYDHRGSEQFKLGKIAESVADFDRYLELRPDDGPRHWKRGISLYYAGQFAEGRKQFEGYEKVDTNDVENAVWHFLCAARLDGVDKARAGLLKIGKDKRVPMTEVYELFAGKRKPAEVLEAAQAGDVPADQRNAQLFYAHLYLGLYAEVTGDRKAALEHLKEAADKHKISHYMGDVARIGKLRLQKELEPDAKP